MSYERIYSRDNSVGTEKESGHGVLAELRGSKGHCAHIQTCIVLPKFGVHRCSPHLTYGAWMSLSPEFGMHRTSFCTSLQYDECLTA